MEKVRTTLTLDPRIRQEMARLKRECEGLSISAMVNAFLGAIVATAQTYRGSRLRLAADVQREIEELRRRLQGGARAGEGREAARRPAPRRTRQRPRLYGIFRERMYSPEREEDDAEILRLTAKHLVAQGWEVELRTVESLTGDDRLPVVFAMCEGRQALERLAEWEAQGSVVINRPAGVLNCYRARMVALLAECQLFRFPRSRVVGVRGAGSLRLDPARGLWVKRGDVHFTQPGDVHFVQDRAEWEAALARLRREGVTQAIIQEHVPGDLVKFCGVGGGAFFRWFYHDAAIRGYAFPAERLRAGCAEAANRLGLEIYGGDGIITQAGEIYLIDINSWPSFARCREEAALAIAAYIGERAGRAQQA